MRLRAQAMAFIEKRKEGVLITNCSFTRIRGISGARADMGRLGKSSVFGLFAAAWFCFWALSFLWALLDRMK